MNGERVVVIGAAGEMARVAVERLVGTRPMARFELYDRDPARLESFASRLPANRVTTGSLDLFETDRLTETVATASLVVLGAGPYLRTAPPVMRACIEAGVAYIDFDDDIESTLDALALDASARAAGVPLLIGCGAAPGYSNVLAVDAVSRLDSVDAIDVCWVTGDEGRHAHGAAALEHLLHISAGDCLTWRDGRQVRVESFVATEVFPFGGNLGDHRLYETAHPEAVTLPRRYPAVRSVRVMGGLHPQPVNGSVRGIARAVHDGRMGVAEAVEWIQAVGLDERASLRGWRFALAGMIGQVRRGESSAGALARFLWMGLRGRHVEFRAAVMVRATGTRHGKPHTVTLRTSTGGAATTFVRSMAAATGISLAAFATLSLDRVGELAGALAPEDWVVPHELYTALERMGVPRREFLVETDDPTGGVAATGSRYDR